MANVPNIIVNMNLHEQEAQAAESQVWSAPAGRMALVMPAGRVWMMEPQAVMAAYEVLQTVSLADLEDMRMRAESRRGESTNEPTYTIEDGAGIIPVVGAMTKRPHCLASMFGGGDASTMTAINNINAALEDSKVKDIWMHMETPGGEVAGSFDLASAVWQANKKKPVYAYMSDQCTSAGYLVGSQARQVFGNENVASGSNGVYTMLADTSKMHAERGVKMHLIKAGKYKGIGAPGIPVSDDDLKTVQGRIDAFHSLFGKAVKRGRGMSSDELSKVMDAQVFIGKQGVEAGLIDEIASFGAAVDMARSGKGRTRPGRTIFKMSDVQLNEDLIDDVELDNLSDVSDVVIAEDAVEEPIAAEVEVVPAQISMAEQLAVFAADAGITGVTASNAEAIIREFVRIGVMRDKEVRVAAGKMSILAGLGNMDTFIASLPFDNARAHYDSALASAKNKGLVNVPRQTAPAHVGAPGSDSASGGEAADADGGNRTDGDRVNDAKKDLATSVTYAM